MRRPNKEQQPADAVRAVRANSPRWVHSANKEGDTESSDLYMWGVKRGGDTAEWEEGTAEGRGCGEGGESDVLHM